ncbi:cytochrome P450 [Cryphonectria parasitica EP155]|uniref:Cytochrome P450 n=1 Tax=Cryphonectria parasitica (strain ATCC 38755 / EP155) TaxID=660469 RepID=A0A9P4XUJ0_CRYP1|nr:cytochrome P450 [Cryphonectria parasitica EP155]KAF3761067.1 cytochrome P450 [Cryphonectria parasitica EP155]
MWTENMPGWLENQQRNPTTPATLTVLLLLSFLTLAIGSTLLTAFTCPVRSLPGPWYTAFTHLVLKYHIIAGRRIYYVDALHARYGPIVRITPSEASIADPAAAQAIHKPGSGFTKSAWYEMLVTAGRPELAARIGVFALRDPARHAVRRKLFARPFSLSSLRENMEGVVRERGELAVRRIREEAAGSGAGGVADALKWWTLMATDVIAQFCFGENFASLDVGKQTPFIDALQRMLICNLLLGEFPLLNWVGPYLPIRSIQRLFEADRIVFDHGSIAIKNMRSASGNMRSLFGQALVQADSAEQSQLTDDTVRHEAANLILAGADTTALTLTYLLWSVLKRPDLRAALEEEVAGLSGGLTHEELVDARLLNSIIDETLRLYTPAPSGLQRDVPAGGQTLCGMYIPAGVVVSTQAYTLHRDPKVFEDPLDQRQKASLMPFGAGTRLCLGIHLSMMELRIATALFFRKCRGARLAADMTDEKMVMVEHFLVAPKGHCCHIVLS